MCRYKRQAHDSFRNLTWLVQISLWQIIELSGYTARVSEMLEVFEDVQRGHCQRQAARETKERKDSIDEAEQPSSVGAHGEVVDLSQMSGGEVVDTEGNIALKDVAIITPCGDVVVSSLSFEVRVTQMKGTTVHACHRDCADNFFQQLC